MADIENLRDAFKYLNQNRTRDEKAFDRVLEGAENKWFKKDYFELLEKISKEHD
jgi:hypothetical protein